MLMEIKVYQFNKADIMKNLLFICAWQLDFIILICCKSTTALFCLTICFLIP